MALNLSDNDHDVLDQYLNAILDAYKFDEMDQLAARSELAHTIASAAKDNLALMSHVKAILKRRAELKESTSRVR